MSKAKDLAPEDDEFREALIELANSDRDTAPIYRAYYRDVYDEEVPPSS